MGINQLFRNDQRLRLGRWPNLDAGSGGYTFVDSHSAGSSQITDNELPNVDWSGATVHIKNIRWSMLDRQVTSSSGHTLTLNQGLSCLISGWTTCAGWGYFINNHLSTLDQDGEWYYDPDPRRVYLYSTAGSPAAIEGSVIQEEADTLRHGGIMLSDGSATAYVTIDNIEIKNWFNHGIGTPGGMSGDIYHDITVQNVTIKDPDAAGVNLSSWLESPSNGRKGLRGGYHMTFTNNTHRWGQPLWHQRIFCRIDFRRQYDREHCPDRKPGQIRHGLRHHLESMHRKRGWAEDQAVRCARFRLRQHPAL